MPEIRNYIRQGGKNDAELLTGLEDLDFGEEFLALIIEYVNGLEKQQAHFHRMNKTVMN